VSAEDTARAFVEAALSGDGVRVAELSTPGAQWTTPKGSVYDLVEVVGQVAPPEDYEHLSIDRDGHFYQPVGPDRVLVLYETVYRWKDDQGLYNRVPSGYVVDVRGGRVARVLAFLDAEKARAAAGEAETAAA
jgi:hypothetical protein